ncbi:MAG TPA: hotdog domain-containing protein [Patescibacteria group bacterium]|nr:hotdog domain-containing protein [Patescibacteria group bacterium]
MNPAENAPQNFTLHHLVKGNDLNHHGTLFAGRGAEWFVESGFIAAASLSSPEHVVCVNIHGMVFSRPVPKGSIIRFDSKLIYTGRTSMTVYVRAILPKDAAFVVDGFLTFIHVDGEGKSSPHGLTVTATDPEDIALQAKAQSLVRK